MSFSMSLMLFRHTLRTRPGGRSVSVSAEPCNSRRCQKGYLPLSGADGGQIYLKYVRRVPANHDGTSFPLGSGRRADFIRRVRSLEFHMWCWLFQNASCCRWSCVPGVNPLVPHLLAYNRWYFAGSQQVYWWLFRWEYELCRFVITTLRKEIIVKRFKTKITILYIFW